MPKPIQFNGVNVIIAENQEPYLPLPAQYLGDPMGTVLTCWEFTEEEAEEFLRTRRIWISHWTFNQAFQPLCPSTDRPVAAVESPNKSKHTQHLDPSDALERSHLREAGYTSPGWYFWDETGSNCHGPYLDQSKAMVELAKYVTSLK